MGEARIWTCTHCGREGAWGKGWCYPVGLPEWVACSQAHLDAIVAGWFKGEPLPANLRHLREVTP